MNGVSMTDDIGAKLASVRARIDQAARAVGRRADDVTLVAVSKTQPDERLEAALRAGQRVFGENYVQEAQAHWAHRRAVFGDLELHLVGPLQTNKVEAAAALFDVIQSVDRERLAAGLAKAEAKLDRRLSYFVQVNTGEEPQKSGVMPADAVAFVDRVREVHGLDVVGLMAIPPFDEPVAPHFALLAKLAARAGVDGLSMGMSADFEQAVRLGATHVRVGTDIFGERPPRS
ncbi:MAG: YggS family pyridoxal phosphate-dependent enzyme [Pseudomonadota bacterium]